jgi:multisubunit Na+/H+ antiporter MnhF subunit
MNEWLWAGAAMVGLLVPCTLLAMRGGIVDRLLGFELGSVVTSLALVVLAQGFARSIYIDLALVFTAMQYGATLMIVRFLERGD